MNPLKGYLNGIAFISQVTGAADEHNIGNPVKSSRHLYISLWNALVKRAEVKAASWLRFGLQLVGLLLKIKDLRSAMGSLSL